MVKTSKRTKKFLASGGVKKRLEKGTITKKGKLKMRKRKKIDPAAAAAAKERERLKHEEMRMENDKKRREEDFTSESNLGDLDLESFLKTAVADDYDSAESDQEDNDAPNTTMDDSSDVESEDEDVDMGSDDDDEDLEAAEARMKAEMAKLAESDPDFHEYLKQNDTSLLDFQNESDENENEEDYEEDLTEDDVREGESGDDEELDDDDAIKSNEVLVDAKVLKSYEYGAFKSHGLKPLRKLVGAYISACHMADAKGANEDSSGRLKTGGRERYVIESSTVFDKLMVTCLAKVHEELHYHLLGDGATSKTEEKGSDDEDDDNEASDNAIDANKPINPNKFTKASRWPVLKSTIQSFIKATLHLMSEAKESKLLNFVIKSLANYVPYLSAFPHLAKALLKTLTSKWSTTSDGTEEYQSVRVNAFLRIRQLALTQPFPFIELCLKSTYLAYARSAKFAKAASITSLLPQLTFMGNCVVELYTLDFASSYQHAFVYIRQLALHLRTALQKKTPETLRVVYCWQYIHCLKLWGAVLAASCGKPGDGDDEAALMRSLIYPLVEVIFGVAKLVPSTRHLPLRLHCVRFLQQLAASSETFIPTTSILLEVFDLKEISMSPKRVKKRGGDVRGVRLPVILKLPKEDTLRTAEQLDACLSEVFLLLNREVDMYKFSAGSPEFCVRICQRLRKFAKETKNGRYRAYAKGCIEICEKNSKFAVLARTKLQEAPKDIKRLEVLRPNNSPSMGERHDMAIAKERRLEKATQPAISKAAKDKAMKEKEMKKKAKEKQTSNVKEQNKKGKKKVELSESDLKNVEALEEEDEVQEGIDWSESEDESMDE